MKNKIIIVIIVVALIISILLAGIGIYKKTDKSIDCNYNLGNSEYNDELKTLCKENNIKYDVYVTKEDLGSLSFDGYSVAKYFNLNYFEDIDNTDASTRKNLILSYLKFNKNTCYSKKLMEDINSDLFTQNVDSKDIIDINKIFDQTEIKNNFICIKDIQSNEVLNASPYYLLNNRNIIKIDIDNLKLSVSNINEYTSNEASENATLLDINNTNTNALLNKEFYSVNTNDYKVVLFGYAEYKFKHSNDKIELKEGEVYYTSKSNKKLLAKDIDKVFLHENEENEEYDMYLLDKNGDMYKQSSDSNLKYEKIDTEDKFVNVYIINDGTTVAQTPDGKIYDLYESKFIDTYERKVYDENDYSKVKYVLKVDLNDNTIYKDNKDTNYKLKYSFDNYILTTDNYLYKISDGKLLSNNKVKEIYTESIQLDKDNSVSRLYITYDNNEKTVLFDLY